tara:strand:- start:1649 stop:2113 length:465 start_codon:yes stop_codon:yes gene_type:complete
MVKKKKERTVTPTAKQMGLIKVLQKQIDNPDREFTWSAALKEAGYTESMQRSPSNVYRAKAFREYVPKLVETTASIASLAGKELARRMSPGNIESERTNDIRNVMKDSITLGRLMNDESTSNSKTTKEDFKGLSDAELYEMSQGEVVDVEVNDK